MKRALSIFVALTFAGCSADTVPPTPTMLPTIVNVVVLEARGGGGCVRDALVEVVAGQGLGRQVMQANGCTWWDPDYSASFNNVTPGISMTLRASAPGYQPVEMAVIPNVGPLTTDVAFELTRRL